MAMHPFSPSELILNPDNSIYHLHLRPEQLAPLIIIVGDPDRVQEVSKHFDRIDEKVQKREFVTHTGFLGNRRISVISTGIGTDNIDIVINELDALVNIDFNSRNLKAEHTTLQIIRIGTSGALQPELPLNSFLASTFGLGLDGLMLYYQRKLNEAELALEKHFIQEMSTQQTFPITPYFAQCSSTLLQKVGAQMAQGITATCPGFYGPQGRVLRGQLAHADALEKLRKLSFLESKITNFEMETAAIYGMANMLGHEAISCNALIANRATGSFSSNPKAAIAQLIELVLEQLVIS